MRQLSVVLIFLGISLGLATSAYGAAAFSVDGNSSSNCSGLSTSGSVTCDFSVNAGSGNNPDSLTVKNLTNSSLQFQVSVSTTSGGNWLSAQVSPNPLAGNASGQLSITINARNLVANNTFKGTVNVSAGGTTVSIAVSVTSNGTALALSPNSIAVQLQVGRTAQRNIKFVDAKSNNQLNNVGATIQTNASWLTASDNNGSSFNVNIDATSLSAGQQNGTVTVQYNGQGGPFVTQTLQVTALVTPPATPNAIPSVLNFSAYQGRANPPSQNVAITTSDGSTQNFFFTTLPPFVTVNPQGGTASTSPTNVAVSVTTSALKVGQNPGTITLSLANNASINLSVTATLAPFTISATPNPVPMVTLAQGASQSVPIQVSTADNASAAVSVTTQTSTGSGWLTASVNTINAPQSVNLTLAAGSMAVGTYNGSVTFACTGATSCSPVVVPVTLAVTAGASTPVIPSNGVLFASNFGAFTTVTPGTFVELYGSNLADTSIGWSGNDFKNGVAPSSLAGVSVTLDGKPAFINFVSSQQVNIVVPDGINTNGTVQLVLQNSKGSSAPVTVKTAALMPGILAPPVFNINGIQYMVALTQDGAYVLPPGAIAGINARPAKPGEVITVYGLGFGPVNPAVPSGTIASILNTLQNSLTMFFGNTAATFQYAGLAPGYVGLYQLNILVPAVPDNNAIPVTFTLGGVKGTQTLNIAVHQ